MIIKKNTILIIDDESQIRKFLTISLKGEGYKVEECDNGTQAIRLASSLKPDLIILDLGLPDIDGKEVLEAIRSWSQVPIIVCSVRDADKEVIDSFNCGADDYVTKPFNLEILLVRIAANLRKSATEEAGSPTLTNGKIHMDLVKHEVLLNGEKTFFTPKEYELLRYFMVNKGKMITHKQLLKDVWGPAHGEDMQYLRVYVSQIREKIEDDLDSPSYIVTETGIGYRMELIEENSEECAETKEEEVALAV